MSDFRYRISQEYGDSCLSTEIDLVDDLGYEESDLDGMGSETLRDLLWVATRDWFRTTSRFNWKKLDA